MLLAASVLSTPSAGGQVASSLLAPTADAWRFSRRGGIRGITVGPIENGRRPGRGYGSPAWEQALDEARAMGATWISVTPFGRVQDLTPEGIAMSFEVPFEENRAAVLRAIRSAHERGLRVMVVPHLWVESGEWRALIDPGSEEGWDAWAEAYRAFLLDWADVAAEGEAELLSVGVELRSWVTTKRVTSMRAIVEDVRARFRGLLTYSSNWDDADDTLLWDVVDLIGVNGFYPLVTREGASLRELEEGGRRVAESLDRLAKERGKPVLLTEMGYTTRADPALRPWEWPESMSGVRVDERAQADAYRALLGPVMQTATVAGFFVWRYFADPEIATEEAAWGFSPRGKLAEIVLRDAFASHFEVDGPWLVGELAGRHRARTTYRYGWEASPPLFP